MNPSSPKGKPLCHYDEAFKRSVLELWTSSGKAAVTVAAELGISHWNLRNWKKQYGASTPASRPASPLRPRAAAARRRRPNSRARIRVLEVDNQSLRSQREVPEHLLMA